MLAPWRTLEIHDRRFEEDEFLAQRTGVLAGWPTGAEVDLDEALAYHRALPADKVQPKQLARVKERGDMMLLPMLGQARLETMLDVIGFCEAECGMTDWSDSWFLLLDAYSRKNRYRDAEQAIEASRKEGRNLLSGYPAVNHGVKGFRQLIGASAHSFHLSNLDEDPRLSAEISLAGGASGFIAYDLHDLLQHSRDFPLDRRIWHHQYVARLAAYYTERGAPVIGWPAGHMNGWETPGLKIAITLLQALTAARQGVKHLACSYCATANVNQDLASMRVMQRLVDEYLQRLGHAGVATYVGVCPHLGVWPADVLQATSMLAWEVSVARMAGAHFCYLKSPDEAASTPGRLAIGGSLKIAKHMLNVLGDFKLQPSEAALEEERIIEMEVRAMVDAALELADGDPSNGTIKAVERGLLDGVFVPWNHAKNRVLTVRDKDGAYRYLDHGALPLPDAVVKYHQARIAQRSQREGRKADIDMVTDDLYYLARQVGSYTFDKL